MFTDLVEELLYSEFERGFTFSAGLTLHRVGPLQMYAWLDSFYFIGHLNKFSQAPMNCSAALGQPNFFLVCQGLFAFPSTTSLITTAAAS